MKELDENALLDALRKGEEVAYQQLISQFRGMVQSLIFKMVQDEEEAKDLSQDVFVQVWESIGGFKGQSSIKTWIYSIAVRKSLNYLRSRKMRQFFRLGDFKTEWVLNKSRSLMPDGYQVMKSKDTEYMIASAVEKLPPNQKAAFVLSKSQGFSDAETAVILGTTVGAVESLLVRAKKNLKVELHYLYNEMKDEK